ncbi:MAG: DUF3830 family protein [Armatimonadota bacterium]|jgi:ribonuclease HI
MSRQIEITFLETDASAEVSLLDEDAPEAAELLWRVLETPLVARAVHAIYAGPAVLVSIPERHGEPRGGQIPVENETQHPEPGDILLLPPADDPAEDIWGEPGQDGGVTVAIFYGDQGRPFSPSGWQPGVVVGKVTAGLGALREACRSVRFEGAQRVCLAREACAEKIDEVVMHSDGASLGNPGPAGAGFVIKTPAGRLLAEGSVPLEPTTVNVAEYRGLIDGLLEAQRLGARKVHALMDSELVVRQLTGEYRVKAENLRPLYQWASKLISSFDAFTCEHVPREKNQRADELAGEAAKRSKERNSRK